MNDFNESPEDDPSEPRPDTDKQPSFGPKRVIHRSKPFSRSGDGNRRPASIFRRKSAPAPASGNQPEGSPQMVQPETQTDNVKPESAPTGADRIVPQDADGRNNPGLRLRTLVAAGNDIPLLKPQSESRLLSRRERARRAYWDVAAGISLIVNAILVALLLIMAIQINNLKTTVNSLLSGLYGNFVAMNKASITSTITVDAQVPIDIMLPIQQNTDVTLTQSVTIPNAYIVINSGGLSINSSARVTLPVGTNLPIALNMAVPVQVTIPVTLQVPVNIPLAQTELHQPFTNLQDTVRAYYCAFDKNAQYPQGLYICNDHDIPTSTPGAP